MCRVLPPIVARNPFLVEEIARGRRKYPTDNIALEYQNVQRRITNRIQEELEQKFLFDL